MHGCTIVRLCFGAFALVVSAAGGSDGLLGPGDQIQVRAAHLPEISERPVPVRIVNYACLALLITCLGATDSSPFIYFKF